MTITKGNRDQILGCIIGGAAGDALGYPIEFLDERTITDKYGKNGIDEYELDPETGKALISDDTQSQLLTGIGWRLRNMLLMGSVLNRRRSKETHAGYAMFRNCMNGVPLDRHAYPL